jgi:DsbC/DsbD-like thiol-disulfide interchange protein
MLKPIALLSALFALIGFCSAGLAGPAQVETMADVSSVAAGQPFTVGFKFTIEPGWHIYWKNPGDSGLPTEVKLKLPEGFTASELMFPVPTRLALPGDILNYAYENQVMLMMKITPPKDLAAGSSVKISGKVTWLVCKDDCTPGSANVELELRVADTAAAANADLFKQWTSRLPLKQDADDIASSSHALAVANGSGTASIDIGWKKLPSDVQFIPAPLKSGDVANIKAVTTGNSTKITFGLTNYKDNEPVEGLVLFTSAAGVKTGVEISIPYGAGGPSSPPPVIPPGQ